MKNLGNAATAVQAFINANAEKPVVATAALDTLLTQLTKSDGPDKDFMGYEWPTMVDALEPISVRSRLWQLAAWLDHGYFATAPLEDDEPGTCNWTHRYQDGVSNAKLISHKARAMIDAFIEVNLRGPWEVMCDGECILVGPTFGPVHVMTHRLLALPLEQIGIDWKETGENIGQWVTTDEL